MMSSLKNFLIIAGMPRTGTSYLYYILQSHPSLFLPYRKELSYFCSNYEKGLSWYHNFYSGISLNQVAVDVTPIYIMHPESAQRIKYFNSNIKIILCIRKPSEWILSWYAQMQSRELKVPPFEFFIKEHTFRPSIGERFHINLGNRYLMRSIELYTKEFGSNILIYNYEFFKDNPLHVLHSFESFVGIPNYFTEANFKNLIINASNRKKIKIFSYILSRGEIIKLLEYVISKRFLQSIRNKFDLISTKTEELNMNIYNATNTQLAKEFFIEEDEYYNSFFAKYPIQLGDKTEFKW